MRYILYIAVLLNFLSFGQEIKGTWKGTLYQDGNKKYYFEIRVDQEDEDGKISGVTYVKESKSGNFGTISFTGTYKNKVLRFQEKEILKEDKEGKGYYTSNNFYWCIKNGTLNLSESDNKYKLRGDWQAKDDCPGGSLTVEKDKENTEKENCDKLLSADFMLGAWRGKFTQHSCGVNNTFPMVVMIDRIDGMKFYGMFIWTDMQYAEDSRSTLEGEIKDGEVYFYENEIISGSGLVLNGIYKSKIINCDKLSGYWYRDYQSKVDCQEMEPYENGGDYKLDHYIVPTVYFDKNSTELRTKSKKDLDEFARFLKDFPSLKFNVDGHTDNTGSNAWNLRLSEKRAQMVIDYIVSKGISPKRFIYKFHGSLAPAVKNSSDENRQLNRRTEIKIKN